MVFLKWMWQTVLEYIRRAYCEPTQEYKSSIVPVFMDEMLCQYISTDNNLNAVIECTTSVDLMKGKWWIHNPTKENTYLYWGVNQLCSPPEDVSVRGREENNSCMQLSGYICTYTHSDTENTMVIYSFSIIRRVFAFFVPLLLLHLPVLLSPGSPDTVVESRAMMRVLVKPGE